jgi:tetratricopeptide (TPR) repeat protein
VARADPGVGIRLPDVETPMNGSIDYESTCFVIMPFGTKPVGKHKVNFDRIYDQIFEPAIARVALPEGGTLRPARTDRDFFAGDISQEMFQYLNRSRFALADITGLNPNVMYEIGVRHAVRQNGTALFRQSNAPIPFDISHIKAFPYNYRPETNAAEARELIEKVLTDSLRYNRLDSPVQIALRAQQGTPQSSQIDGILLEAENAVRRFDKPAAIATLRRALRVGGDNALILMRLGLLLRDQGDLEGAVEEFTRATTAQPDYSDAWRERGINEARLTKNARGEEALRTAIRLNPEDFDALASLGGILRKTGRLEEAAAMYENAVKVSGGHPYPLLMAFKLKARTAGTLPLDGLSRKRLQAAEEMRRAQAETVPPIDAPWCLFDLAEIRLYAGDTDGFHSWVDKGLNACKHKYEPQTFRSALQLLIDGGVRPAGLDEALPRIDARIAELLD